MLRWRLAALGFVPLLVGTFASPAAAATELISIPVDRVFYGDPGEEVLVASATVPADVVGLSCLLTGETVNQGSEHPDNDLLIRVGGDMRVFRDFEDERDIRYTFTESVVLADRVDIFVRLGPDGVTSGGFLISFECETPPTSSTTSSTTTLPASTSSTVTSSTVPSSTVPSTTVTTTSIAGPTTSTGPTTSIDGPTTSVPATSVPTTGSIAQEEPPPTELAFTGLDTPVLVGLGALGAGLVLLGGFALGRGARQGSF